MNLHFSSKVTFALRYILKNRFRVKLHKQGNNLTSSVTGHMTSFYIKVLFDILSQTSSKLEFILYIGDVHLNFRLLKITNLWLAVFCVMF